MTNDRSAPMIERPSKPIGGPSPSTLSAPPVPGRARSNSDQGNRAPTASTSVADGPPQPLAGLFAGGMPKLRKTGKGIDTGGMYPLLILLLSCC